MLNRAGRNLEVALPDDLARFGGSTRARIAGPPDGPLVVAIGGISADRFVVERPDGAPGWWSGLGLSLICHRVLGLDFAADPAGRVAPTTHDQARVLAAALDAAGADAADLVLGASYGGMVALAFAETRPERVRRLAIVSAPARPHPFATAQRELQRRIVALGIEAGRGEEALALARGMAMTTYRTPEEFAERFEGGISSDDPLAASAPGAYLRARGEAYRGVMTPQRFLSLSASIDRHRIDPARIEAPALLVGCTGDRLVPPEQMEALAAELPNARLHLVDCIWGHDMFLKEAAALGALIGPFLEQP